MADNIDMVENALGKTKNMVIGIIGENIVTLVTGDCKLVLAYRPSGLKWFESISGSLKTCTDILRIISDNGR
jgi:hypothetical protein